MTIAGCLGVPDPLPSRPDAVAGIDAFGTYGEPVALDGSGSSSPNGTALTWYWSFAGLPEQSALTEADLSPNGTADAAHTAFTPDRAGRYVIQLIVDDGVARSAGDYVVVDVEGGPEGPVAVAGEDQTVQQGMAVYLDGSNSFDPDGKPIYYRWTLAGTPSLSSLTSEDLINPYTPYPTLVVDAGGIFTLSLVVSDGDVESSPDYVFITVASNNSAPIAEAGGDRAIEACTSVDLDGSSSYDIDRDTLQYAWSVLLSPLYSTVTTEALETPDQASSRFYADRTGSYVVQLMVSDGALTSEPDIVSLTAVPRSYNAPPTVTAGSDLSLTDEVLCTGSGSSAYCPDCPALDVSISGSGTADEDGDTMTFAWSVLEGTVQVTEPTRLSTTAELRDAKAVLGATVVTTYRLLLSATDCPGETGQDELVIQYSCTGKE